MYEPMEAETLVSSGSYKTTQDEQQKYWQILQLQASYVAIHHSHSLKWYGHISSSAARDATTIHKKKMHKARKHGKPYLHKNNKNTRTRNQGRDDINY